MPGVEPKTLNPSYLSIRQQFSVANSHHRTTTSLTLLPTHCFFVVATNTTTRLRRTWNCRMSATQELNILNSYLDLRLTSVPANLYPITLFLFLIAPWRGSPTLRHISLQTSNTQVILTLFRRLYHGLRIHKRYLMQATHKQRNICTYQRHEIGEFCHFQGHSIIILYYYTNK